MQQLKMKKRIIKGVRDYCRYFSPAELIYNRKTAALFLCNRFSHLSDTCQYHTEIFFKVVFLSPLDKYEFNEPSDYVEGGFVTDHCDTVGQMQRLITLMQEENIPAIAGTTWKIADGTSLPSDDKIKLFLLLTAAYALAHVSPDDEEYSITSQQAENAYLKKKEEEKVDINSLLLAGRIPANEEPYNIILRYDEAEKLLEEGATIEPRKVVAVPHAQGVRNVDVKLDIYSENQQEPLSRITVKTGDYIYINFVGDCPVLVHPTESRTDIGTAQRQGNTLTYSAFGKMQQSIDCSKFDVICLAAEDIGRGFLFVSKDGIEDGCYSRKSESLLCGNRCAEIVFINGSYVYLTPKGEIRTKLDFNNTDKKFITLGKFLEAQ